MSEPSPILRALRPRIQKRSTQKQVSETEASEEEADGGTNQMDTSEANIVEEQKDDEDSNVYNEVNDNNNDDDDENMDDEDDDDDDEPRLTIKEEPDEDDATEDKVDSDNKYECKSCRPTVEFPSLVEYMKHWKELHRQRAKCHECPNCNFICQHPSKLERHILSAHKENDDNATGETNNPNQCTMCSFVANNQSDMNNHQRLHHLKRRFFRCTKCSYMTHVRARYTKHVKYHSMPMIKCDDCDFRTPYKWNLDRHTRNHGGGGAFQCRACNFTADIRQSLTVHETNHHEPPVGQWVKKYGPFDRKPRNGPKRYNQVGASDYRDSQDEASPSKGETEVTETSEDPTGTASGAECIALKCDEKGCQFITAWDSEMQRHLMECHAPPQSPTKSKKPLPMLIPLSPENTNVNNATSNGSSPLLKVPRVRVRPELAKIARDTEMAKIYNNRESTGEKKSSGGGKSFEKRNASFFDKLKEKLMTSTNAGSSQVAVSTMDLKCWCTFEASNTAELARHKQTHHTALSVTSHELSRCPKCRKPFNSLTDLQFHVQVCSAANNDLTISTSSQENTGISANYMAASHYGDFEFPLQVDWDASGGLNSSGSSIDGATSTTTTRRVFKCPHCSFWASTASRFHVHIVGHLNRKPFECSLCAYRSNWRWDITKHIKLKAARDPAHATARVLMTDETGRRNYSKYNKYLAQLEQNTEDQNTDECGNSNAKSDEPPRKRMLLNNSKKISPLPELTPTPKAHKNSQNPGFGRVQGSAILSRPPPPLQAARGHGQSLLKSNPAKSSNVAVSIYPSGSKTSSSNSGSTEETKRTLWKCKRCNYRDANKEMVLTHVKSHYESLEQPSTNEKNSFVCKDCPYVANDATSLAMHQVHHRPNLEAIFKCYLCPYYVSTKAELLDHARLHGEELAVVHQRNMSEPASKKPKNSAAAGSNSSNKSDVSMEEVSSAVSPILSTAARNPDGSTPPLLLDTRALPDTPLVWVSRPDGTFVKMLKCRHCPHVSSRRAEVRDHEIMHTLPVPNGSVIACPDCSFSCARKEVMEHHADMHRGALGTVHCLVDNTRSDAQQLDDLTTLLGLSRTPVLGVEPDLRDLRLAHHCNKCPARFLNEKELRIHLRYHSADLSYACEWCSYAAKQPTHLLAHQKAHSAEYQDRTRQLLFLYGHSQRFPPPRTACIETDSQIPGTSKNIACIVVEVPTSNIHSQHEQSNEGKSGNQVFTCAKCPARYFKLDALEYHMTLHGSNNRFKCSDCDYSSKTAQNLVKHRVVHKRQNDANEALITRLQASSDSYFNDDQNVMRNDRFRDKRFKCHKCPTSFDKREQYQVHLTMHGSKQRYRCDSCDFSVKYYANYVQHLKKHQENDAEESLNQLDETTNQSSGVEYEQDYNENRNTNAAKSRRKSTISSNVISNNFSITLGNYSNISNQDKQSLLLMQRKEDSELYEEHETLLRCHECPFSSVDKETLDCHKRRHGLERLTPPCPHCNYVPRKDENLGEHIKLHFTRLYKPESYLVVDLLSLTMRRLSSNKKDEKKDSEVLFCDCGDGNFLPVINSHALPPVNVTNGNNLEKVIVDPVTGETTHRLSM